MARIVVITHPNDHYLERNFYLHNLVRLWRQNGHRIALCTDPERTPDADVAILHVDFTIVPQAWVEAARRYRAVVNGAATDISKRHVSRAVVQPGDGWQGPVVVKTNLNCGGVQEAQAAELEGRNDVVEKLAAFADQDYPIYESVADVPEDIWRRPELVVERFLPERDTRGYWVRTWFFFGAGERCSRYLGDTPIVKIRNILAREPAEVPDELRAERERLGFDYGKFDFVMHEGKAVLFDANHTPCGRAPAANPDIAASDLELARSLDAWLTA